MSKKEKQPGIGEIQNQHTMETIPTETQQLTAIVTAIKRLQEIAKKIKSKQIQLDLITIETTDINTENESDEMN